MKYAKDTKTMEMPMPGAKRGRGRPPTFNAMTNAERQKAYRDRVRAAPTPKSSPTEPNEFPWSTQRTQVETALYNAQQEIAQLRKEQATLIAERAAAWKAIGQWEDTVSQRDGIIRELKLELQGKHAGSSAAGKLANQVLQLEAEKAQMIEDKNILAHQGAVAVQKLHDLEYTIKRNASRNKKSTEAA